MDRAPLLRVGYGRDFVAIDMHHIITDGRSMAVFLRELNELYMGRTLADNPTQYREFALQKNDNTLSEQYWLSVFADEPPLLELNTDFPRKGRQTFGGTALYERLPLSIHEKICEKCREQKITPYVFYMGAFHILLSKLSGGEDIAVGMPTSGRSGKFLDTIGMFVNTVVIRSQPGGTKTVGAFLQEISRTTVDALEHQDYPYGELVKKLGIHAENRNPLFDVMFAYQSEEMTEVVLADESAKLLEVPVTNTKYDITFNIMPGKSEVALMVEYCTDLYREAMIFRMVEGYKQLLSQMLETDAIIQQLSAVTEPELQKLLYNFNDTAVDYPREKCVHELFEERVERTPEKVAVIASDKIVTYQELNKDANRIAHGLVKRGVKKGDIVAFALSRKSYLIAAIFGILKTGAAYLPIDSEFPQDRIDFILKDSKARLLLSDTDLVEMLANDDTDNLNVVMDSDSICYCIYTSGSTGEPKGVVIRHCNVVNFCSNKRTNLNNSLIKNCDCVLAINAIMFDIVLQEIHLPLLNEKTVFLTESSLWITKREIQQLVQMNYNFALITTPTKLSGLLI